MSDFNFRPDTWDESIFCQVMYENEYDIPDNFEPTDIIVDIGGHIGSFSHACLLRGAGEAHIFEPETGNFNSLCDNLLPNWGDRVHAHQYAVWKSGEHAQSADLRHGGYSGPNTGGGSVVFGSGEPVNTIAFDDVLESIGGPVRLLKIDAEYSEYPIILTSRLLASRVKEIVGEIHEMGGEHDSTEIPDVMKVDEYPPPYTAEMMQEYFNGIGYDFSYRRLDPQSQVIFNARRREPLDM